MPPLMVPRVGPETISQVRGSLSPSAFVSATGTALPAATAAMGPALAPVGRLLVVQGTVATPLERDTAVAGVSVAARAPLSITWARTPQLTPLPKPARPMAFCFWAARNEGTPP